MSLWTVQQHEWLRALGHPVLLLAGDPGLVGSPDKAADAETLAATVAAQDEATAGTLRKRPLDARNASGRTDLPRSRGGAGAGPPTARPAHPPASAPDAPTAEIDTGASPPTARADPSAKKAALEAARGARRSIRRAATPLPTDDLLLHAIVRASGLDAGAFQAAAQEWRLDLARLRAEPLSKRALWQQMRQKGRNRAR